MPVQVLRNGDGSLAHGEWNQMRSSNWSGYVVPSYLNNNAPYTSASMTWKVPAVTAQKGGTQYSANWVGIGGSCLNSGCTSVDNTLIQLGTEQDVGRSGANYYAWYELIPASEVQIANAPVAPGDVMTATLSCASPAGGTCVAGQAQSWTLTMSNQSTTHQGWTWSPPAFSYTSSLTSAEWIEEAPSSIFGVLPLANFGTAQFLADAANGAAPALNLTVNGIQMADPHGQTSNPSAPSPNEAFNACWGYRTFTPC